MALRSNNVLIIILHIFRLVPSFRWHSIVNCRGITARGQYVKIYVLVKNLTNYMRSPNFYGPLLVGLSPARIKN